MDQVITYLVHNLSLTITYEMIARIILIATDNTNNIIDITSVIEKTLQNTERIVILSSSFSPVDSHQLPKPTIRMNDTIPLMIQTHQIASIKFTTSTDIFVPPKNFIYFSIFKL